MRIYTIQKNTVLKSVGLILITVVLYYTTQHSILLKDDVDDEEEVGAITYDLGHRYQNVEQTTTILKPLKELQTFKEAISSVVDNTGRVIISSADIGYIDMTENFYRSSILQFGLTNYLLVCNDIEAYEEARRRRIPSFFMKRENSNDSNSASMFGTKEFRMKTHFKTDIVLKALQLGVIVLLVDVDIVFLRNPMPYIVLSENYDIYIQDDTVEINSGFYLVKPTVGGMILHARALAMAKQKPHLSNQKTIKITLDSMIYHNLIKLFPNGKRYFEDNKRMLPEDNVCNYCAIVHNNWITGYEAKIYRFREHGMWIVDGKDRYYSDPNRRYLTYTNPKFFGKLKTKREEHLALINALLLSDMLNRTLILPRFHCDGCVLNCEILEDETPIQDKRCLANLFFSISHLKDTFSFRESIFLKHKYVPISLKLSYSPVIQLYSKDCPREELTNTTGNNAIVFESKSEITEFQIRTWLKDYSSKSILRLDSLYCKFSGYNKLKDMNTFKLKIFDGLRSGNYRQYDYNT